MNYSIDWDGPGERDRDEDIVNVLRRDVFYGDERLARMGEHNPMHMMAADEIERLRRIVRAWEHGSQMSLALRTQEVQRQIEQNGELIRLRADKDAAYLERNRLVALLASLYPSGITRTDIPGWLPEWHGCVYIDLPTGQASWHYHDGHAHLFAHLPPYAGKWDGHTTDEKYERVAALGRDLRK